MNNRPLIISTGLAVAALAALAGVLIGRGPEEQATTAIVPPAEIAAEAPKAEAPEPAKPAEPAQTAEAGKPPEPVKPAEIAKPDEPAKVEELAKTEEPAKAADPAKPAEPQIVAEPEKAAEPTKPAAPDQKPEFDTVRIEPDGEAIIAGQAKPGAAVTLKANGKEIGKGIANEEGSWVVVPDAPLAKGAHELVIEQQAEGDAPMTSEQSVAVSIPEEPGKTPMIALVEPGAATKVLQQPGTQEVAAAEPPKPAEPEKPKTEIAASEQTPESVEATKSDAPPPAEPQKPAEPVEIAKSDPIPVPSAEKPAETAAKQPDAEAQQTAAAEPAKPAEAAPPKTALTMDSVDYNDAGGIVFSGRAEAGAAVRLYVDNVPVGDAMASAAGKWTYAGTKDIAAGTHDLRVDHVDQAGKVQNRIELPFLREKTEKVIALNAPEAAIPDTAATAKGDLKPEEPAGQATSEPAAQPPAQPESQATAQPEAQTTAQPEAQATAQPEAQATAQPEAQATAQPEAKATSAPKPRANPPPMKRKLRR